ncbi:MAG: hypothetical protein HY979_03180 [Candidatus Magasanikbacteria bacterium]|nr:hypothetical protein [Candidatus Magasanikbacteria bacterium]
MNNNFLKENWYKFWGGNWSILTCSYWGDHYIRTHWLGRITFLQKVIITFKEGASSAFAPRTEIDRFGKYLVEMVNSDQRFAKIWCENLKLETDRIRKFISKNIKNEINESIFNNFLALMDDYYVPHIKIKYTVDFLSPDLLKKLLPDFQAARVYAEPVFKETEDFVVALAKQIEKTTGCPYKLVLCLVEQEMAKYFKTKKLPKKSILNDRYKHSTLIFSKEKSSISVGTEAKKIEKITSPKISSDLKGVCGFGGKVTGQVMVVANPREANTFKDGYVLVASMTRPDFLPLMKKAAAFVTDSGGILCHAAIVAREMKKPCVISTLTGSKFLKTGDIVEVDADKGTVRKLS